MGRQNMIYIQMWQNVAILGMRNFTNIAPYLGAN